MYINNNMPPQHRRKINIQTVFIAIVLTLLGVCLFSSITTVQVIVQFDNPKSKLLGTAIATPMAPSQAVESSLNQFASMDTAKGDRIEEQATAKTNPKEKKGKKDKKVQKVDKTENMVPSTIVGSDASPSIPMEILSIDLATRSDIQVVNTSITFPTYVSDPVSNAAWPRVAWLLSFPNSGTSFSIHAVRKITQLCTGTNYVHESKDPHPTPIISSSPHGPYWIDLKRFPEIPEDSYVLTKTHCDGFCNANAKCKAQKYMVNATQFQLGCLGQKETKNSTKNLPYSPDIVARAIHLVRDPLDNIVSRFHLSYKKFTEEQKATYSNDATGFQAFCTNLDSLQYKSDKVGIQELFIRHNVNATDLYNVPCWSDFYRFVSWHNNALQVKANMRLPSITVYYEDYEGDQGWNTTVTRMLTFLKQSSSKKGKMHKFKVGKSYHDYYSVEQQKAIWKLIAKLSFVDTWEILKRYTIA